jgi:hypothetical protein
MPSRTQRLRRKVEHALQAGDVERALLGIEREMLAAWRASRHRQLLNFGSAEADALCRRVGQSLLRPAVGEAAIPPAEILPAEGAPGEGGPEAGPDIYVASRLYATGGHTALIGDYMRSAGGRPAVLALTDMENLGSTIAPNILAHLKVAPSQFVVCPVASRRGKVGWLDALLARHRPARVFLFTHPQDSAAIAACQPRPGRRYIFVHHVDRRPSLGAFMAGAVHVDLTPFCFDCCRRQAGIADNLFLPIVAPDLGCRRFERPRPGFRGLTTASSGSADKFRLDHRPNYADAVAAVLGLTGGRHVHIGDLPRRYLAHLRAALARQGVAADRIRLVRAVPSLWRALEDFEVDLYIGSFPLRGARASVEAMGSGTPALWHVVGEASRFHDTHMKYPEAAVWHEIADLLGIIRGINADWLWRQSQAARRHYEDHHHPRILAACLSGSELHGRPAAAPSRGLEEPRLVGFDDLPAGRFEALRPLLDRLAGSVRAKPSSGGSARARPL